MNEYKTGKNRNDFDMPESLKTLDYIWKFPLAKAATDTSDNQFDANEINRNPSNVVQSNIDNKGKDT